MMKLPKIPIGKNKKIKESHSKRARYNTKNQDPPYHLMLILIMTVMN